jgi:hypothetical protein
MHVRLLILIMVVLTGCVHRIQVNPLPAGPTSTTIPRSLQIAVGPLLIEGADHMPGITLLEWPQRDLSQALIRYVQQRDTFSSVSTNPADLTLRVATKLALASRQGRYHYRVRLQAEMSETAQLIKAYLVEHVVAGSSVRWVTASDRDPIEAALQLALDDLLTQIESDRSLSMGGKGQPAQ